MSLFVIDDHPLVRQAIGMLLRRLQTMAPAVLRPDLLGRGCGVRRRRGRCREFERSRHG